MPYIIGVVLGIVTFLLARVTRLDRDGAFYPTLVIIIPLYYVLFAAMGDTNALAGESLISVVFMVVAIAGFRVNQLITAGALAAHGVSDIFHSSLIDNAGVPAWWPPFCLAIDVTLAVLVAVRYLPRRNS